MVLPGCKARQAVADLCVASYEGDVDRVRALLDAGVEVDSVASAGNVRGYTALTAACGFSMDTAATALLLEAGATANLPNHYGRSPLMCAVINSNAAATALLLASGAALDQRHKNSMTALGYARLAVAESADDTRTAALATESVLLRWRARQRFDALARLTRVIGICRRFEAELLLLFADVKYRPEGRGALESRKEFEALAAGVFQPHVAPVARPCPLSSLLRDDEAKLPCSTQRLYFAWWENVDSAHAHELWECPAVTRLIGGPWSAEQVDERLVLQSRLRSEHGVQYWPVFLRNTDEFVGCCGLRPRAVTPHVSFDLGFHLRERFWGQRLAFEAAASVIAHAFGAMHLSALHAGHNPHNHASRKTLLRSGFVYVRDEFYEPTGLVHPTYRLLATEHALPLSIAERIS